MTDSTLTSANGYKATIDKITAVQSKLTAATGEKGYASVVDAEGTNLVSQAELAAALGSSAYDTLAASTLTAINTALTSAKSAAQTSLTAL